MTPYTLHELIVKQKRHDEAYHRDVYYLPSAQRLNHLVFHFAKYVGRLNTLVTGNAETTPLQRTLADTFIIALSTAELLSIDPKFAEDQQSLPEMSPNGAPPKIPNSSSNHLLPWFAESLAILTGRMAKACESLDHLEAYDYRTTLSDSTKRILATCIVMAHQSSIDLTTEINKRWQSIEQSRIF